MRAAGRMPRSSSAAEGIAKRSRQIPITPGEELRCAEFTKGHLLDHRSGNLENNEPFLFRIPVDCAGTPCYLTSIPRPNSKRGDNYNHKLTWYQHVPEELRRGKPYDWYPRGRVEIRRTGRATIYLNPDLATDAVISYITEKFNLQHLNVKVVADGSGTTRITWINT